MITPAPDRQACRRTSSPASRVERFRNVAPAPRIRELAGAGAGRSRDSRLRSAPRRKRRSCSSGSTLAADRNPMHSSTKTSCGDQAAFQTLASNRIPDPRGRPTRRCVDHHGPEPTTTSTWRSPNRARSAGSRSGDYAAVTESLLCASTSGPPVDLTSSPCAKAFLVRAVHQVHPEVIVELLELSTARSLP